MAEKNKGEGKTLLPRRSFFGLDRWGDWDMERMMDDFFGRRMRSWPEKRLGAGGMDLPVVDLYEDRDEIVVKAELPGMEKDNIEVKLTDHTLTIKGEKKKEEETKEKNYYRSERSYGSFIRNLELPTDVHTDQVKANFKNGILEVRLPKTEEAKANEVKVKMD